MVKMYGWRVWGENPLFLLLCEGLIVFSIVLLLLLVLIVWRGGLKLLVLLSSSVQGTAGIAGGSRSMVSFLLGRRRPAVLSGLNFGVIRGLLPVDLRRTILYPRLTRLRLL